MNKSMYNDMNSRTLFDAPLTPPSKEETVAPSVAEEDDFFGKLDEIEIEDSILGEDVNNKIKAWVDEYNEFNAEIAKLKKALDAYSAFVKETPVFGLKQDSVHRYAIKDLEPKLEHKSMLDPKDRLLAARIKELVQNRWQVDLSHDDMLEKLDFTSIDDISGYIAENINFGDTGGIVLEQKLASFKEQWRHNEFAVKGKKVFVQDAFYFSDFDFEFGSFSWDHQRKLANLEELLKLFHKEKTGVEYSAINACFSYYSNRVKTKDCFEKIEEGSDPKIETIMSTKLYKNGKFEVQFVDAATAQSFYDEYIAKAMIIGQGGIR